MTCEQSDGAPCRFGPKVVWRPSFASNMQELAHYNELLQYHCFIRHQILIRKSLIFKQIMTDSIIFIKLQLLKMFSENRLETLKMEVG
jgi:hypothetical protein